MPLWYPLENHVKYYRTLEKIDMSVVMGDEFLFRSLLLSSATILNRAEGSTEISSMAVPVLCTLNKRICDQPVPTNSTISIIIVLAVLEVGIIPRAIIYRCFNRILQVITGNFTRWKHHICAATEMFRLRGGLTNITVCLKEKLTRYG